MCTWSSNATVPGSPADVLAFLTEPEAIALWAPVPFEVLALDGERLRSGSRARVAGHLAGRSLEFEVQVLQAAHDRLELVADGPIRALTERNPEVNFSETTDVLMGAASSIGEQGYNVGRNASLLAGLDHHVPACTVNRFCASSLQTIRMAFHAIKSGEGEQYIASGVEAVSRAGLGAGIPDEAKHPKLNGSEGSAYDVYMPMGMTAENVAERCKVTREQQDEWAVISQSRAVEARESGHFDPEIG